MKIRSIFLGVGLLIAVSISAQDSDVAVSVPKQIPQETQLLELAGKLISFGRQTKSALALIQAVQIIKQLNVVDDKENASGQTSPFSEAQLLADATKFADGNKHLLALIKDTEKSTRAGWEIGPIRIYRTLEPGGVFEIKNWFKGGQMAQIVVDGQGEGIYTLDDDGNVKTSDLRLTVYDSNGRIIATDQSRGKNCSVCFVPRSSSQLTVEVKNAGTLTDDCVLYIYSN